MTFFRKDTHQWQYYVINMIIGSCDVFLHELTPLLSCPICSVVFKRHQHKKKKTHTRCMNEVGNRTTQKANVFLFLLIFFCHLICTIYFTLFSINLLFSLGRYLVTNVCAVCLYFIFISNGSMKRDETVVE